MNLLQLRTLFRDISGRYDLVTTGFANNGSDFYINEGSKWLDKMDETQNSWASYIEVITAGTWYLQFPSCRAIKEVWAATQASGRRQLVKVDLQDMLAGYLSTDVASVTNGTPEHYCPAYARYIPETVTPAQIATFATYIQIPVKATYGYNTLILSIPVDDDTLIDVKGLFYSATLTADTDENYWSAQHPLLLAMAAVRQVHMSSGNIQGMKNIDEPLRVEMSSLGMDLVEQLIAEVDQMEG